MIFRELSFNLLTLTLFFFIFVYILKILCQNSLNIIGLVLRFFLDEHEPIHIHAFYNDCQLKVEFNIVDGIISSIIYKKIQGYDVIPEDKKKDLEKLIEIYKYEIIQL